MIDSASCRNVLIEPAASAVMLSRSPYGWERAKNLLTEEILPDRFAVIRMTFGLVYFSNIVILLLCFMNCRMIALLQ